MTLADVALVDQSEEASVVRFSFDVTNSNADEIPLRDFRYIATIDGVALPATRSAAEATVRRLGTQRVSIPVVIPHALLNGPPTGARRLTIAGQLSYVAPGAIGEMLFDTGVRVPEMSFSHSVDLNFPSSTDEP